MKNIRESIRRNIESHWLSCLILTGLFLCTILPSLIQVLSSQIDLPLRLSRSALLLCFLMPGIYVLVNFKNKRWHKKASDFLILGLIILYVVDCFIKMLPILRYAWDQRVAGFLDTAILNFIMQRLPEHGVIFSYFAILLLICYRFSKERYRISADQFLKWGKQVSSWMSLVLILLTGVHFILYKHSHEFYFRVSSYLLYVLILGYLILNLLLLVCSSYFRRGQGITQLSAYLARQHVITVGLLTFFIMTPAFIELKRTQKSWLCLNSFFKYHAKELVIIFTPLLMLLGLFLFIRKVMSPLFTVEDKATSGSFGSARFANHKDLEQAGFYEKSSHKILSGTYLGRDIYLPLKNKLTLSPQGGGKTSCSSINVLLTHPGNTFVFDVKGELWATTARYRREVLKKEVVAIDPYSIRKMPDFAEGKAPELLKEYCFNPFDWISADQRERDRMINAFAASFVINEGGSIQHFDDNAKILIRGFMDYIMQVLPKESRTLETLYQLLSEHENFAKERFTHMSRLEGRAGAAGNQVSRVGSDERGSILSTSYRQIDWMSDSNLKACLSHSNFDLKKFVSGQMDIFVILPEDQVKEHQRFVRMLLALIVSQIVQVAPGQLPQEKMLFLLDELAQLGYCPDVEQAIEVLRARKLVVWTVFQTLSQIKQYKKPDLFLSAFIKQVFTNDDVETMQWIQALSGKKTILSKTVSTNKGDSRQKMQLLGGSISSGEGESAQETGVDLLQLNEIRELGENDQFIFMHGLSPMKCKKLRYYQHVHFKNKFDSNPLEVAFAPNTS